MERLTMGVKIERGRRSGRVNGSCLLVWLPRSFSTMTRSHIHSGDYLKILYRFRNLYGGLKE
ncbi:hypothetical protein E2C01_060665 [Portunus trituberculatus]|uniref:Uncharacterized protein n=1 Tax=Portunus trituberculatus TaxID=210409 RepID=A0A5B7HB48_PORTR|nr:hypothetical protein [Portunus trituberculatus]